MNRTPLHIITTGMATAIGGYTTATLAAVQARIANFTRHPYLLDVQGEPYVVAMAPYIDPKKQGTPRFSDLLGYALCDCFSGKNNLPDSMPCVLCLPEECSTFNFQQVRQIVQQLMKDCPGLKLTSQDVYCEGHSAAYKALEQVYNYLQEPGHEFCLLAGVDSYIDSMTLNILDLNQQVHTTDNPYGFVPGEAAACLVFCSEQTQKKYQLDSLGALTGFSHTLEPIYHRSGVCTGQGLTKVMREVIHFSHGKAKIRHAIGDLNGEPHRSDEYGFTLTRLSQYFHSPEHFTAPADCWGDVGAATGLLSMVLATESPVVKKEQSGPILLWASSMRDGRGAALFQPPINSQ